MKPLVSVIVTTYNNHATLDACLSSIRKQSYERIEIVVVDNHSTDDTIDIARKYTPHVYTKGPERSTQRNYAVHVATGDYVVIIDSDMELSEHVIRGCVERVQEPETQAVIIPEESFGEGFWAQCKRLERSFYVGVDWMEAARFFKRDLYVKLGGYDEKLISGEDWDLSQRAAEQTKLGRIDSYIYHNEGRLKLGRTLKKKYYYAKQFSRYTAANKGGSASANVSAQTGPLTRYKLFFSKPGKLFSKPFLGIGMLFMKTCEFGFGAVGLLKAKGGGA